MIAVHSPAVWLPTIRAGTGSDVFTERLCRGLNDRGIRSEICWLPARAEYLPWTVAKVRAPKWANIVHVNSWLPRRFWPAGLPVVATLHHLVHDPAYHPFRSVAQTIYHELLIRRRELASVRQADAVTTVSEFVRATVTAFSGREQISVIYNWIDANTYTPAKNQRPVGSEVFRLFMAGTHSRRKGIDLLPRFAQALGPGFEIRYAGGKKDLDLPASNVISLGRIDEQQLIKEFQRCDAVVSLSRYEGFGYTALEAAACGKPFLGFHTSGLAEVVMRGHGTLVPVEDIHALVTAVHALREQPSPSASTVADQREQLLARFSESNINDYIDLYTHALTKSSHPDA
jgi:glycosyltransferase involved in cell wall biosynthesis